MPTASFAERLRAARDLSGLSARALAQLSGLTDSHVGLLEADQRTPNTLTAAAVANTLGISLDWLVLGQGDAPREEDVRAAVERARARAAMPATGTEG